MPRGASATLSMPPARRREWRAATGWSHAAADTGHGALRPASTTPTLPAPPRSLPPALPEFLYRGPYQHRGGAAERPAASQIANESTPDPCPPCRLYSASKVAAGSGGSGAESARMPDCRRARALSGRDDTTARPQLAAAARTGKLGDEGGLPTRPRPRISTMSSTASPSRSNAGAAARPIFHHRWRSGRIPQLYSALLERAGCRCATGSVPRWLVSRYPRAAIFSPGSAAGGCTGRLAGKSWGTVGVEVTLDITKARTELGYAPVIDRAARSGNGAGAAAGQGWLKYGDCCNRHCNRPRPSGPSALKRSIQSVRSAASRRPPGLHRYGCRRPGSLHRQQSAHLGPIFAAPGMGPNIYRTEIIPKLDGTDIANLLQFAMLNQHAAILERPDESDFTDFGITRRTVAIIL